MLNLKNSIKDIYENSVLYDYIMIHSDITQLLYTNDHEIVKEQFFNLFKKLTDNKKTLIIPTFNWDFCGGTEYHYLNTPSKVGILSKWCLDSPLFERTNDPVYSCAISGINKNTFLDYEYTTAFGKDSIFDRVNNLNSLVIMINNEHLTIVHYYEQLKNSTYRYNKKFKGSVTYKKNKKNINYEQFVRSYEINEINNNCFSKYKNYNSIIKNKYYDNFYINFIDLNIFSNEFLDSISNNKYFLVKNKVEVSYNLNYINHTKQFDDSDMFTFAKISGDYNPLHYDKEFSKNLIFKDWILHGMNGVLFSLNNLSQNIDIKEIIYIKKIDINYKNPIYIDDKITFNYSFLDKKIEIKILGEDILLTSIHLEYELINNLLSIDDFFDDKFNFKDPCNVLSKDFKNYNKKTEIKANIKLIKSYYPNLLKKFNFYQILVLITISRNVGMVFPGLNSICMKINVDFLKNNNIKDIYLKYNSYFNNILTIDLSSDCLKGNIYVNTNRNNLNYIYLLSYKNIDFVKKELENNFKTNEYKILSCEYNQLEQDVINKESELYKSNPSFIFLINRIEDIFKIEFIDIYDKNFDILFDNYINLIRNLRKNINSGIYINSFHHTTIPITQNAVSDNSLDFLINSYNEKLYKLSDELADVNIINSNIFSNCNKIDFKSYFIGNYNYSYEYSSKLADFMYGLIMNKLGNSIRLIVIDLDNTLWGGVVGEDGVNGIKIGETYPGNCFTYFQKVLKSFTKIGISLALCSKNDEKIAKQVFDERPEMILKYDDFISKKINWNNKSENILNISNEVGLGLKNILFIDDNPIEREEVKQILPDINILEIDYDSPEDYAKLLLSNRKLVFNKILEEDLKRDVKYKKNSEFTNLKTNYSDIQEFYKSLKSKVYLNKLSDKNIDRCESLINKTNQFNFTTIRLNKNQIIEMSEKNYDFYVIGYENTFFEYENIGVIIFDNNQNEIYNYLLSCRVIGKGIEEDILIFLINYLKSKNIKNMKGKIIPTDRNIPVREIFNKLNFTQIDETTYNIELDKFSKTLVNTEIILNSSDILTCNKTDNKKVVEKNEVIVEKNEVIVENKYNKDTIIIIYDILSNITTFKPNIDDKITYYDDWDSLKTILFISQIENKFKIKIKGNYFDLSIKDIICLI